MLKKILIIGAIVNLAACTSMKSTPLGPDKTKNTDGLAYFMPKKDFMVTVTTEKHTKPAVGTLGDNGYVAEIITHTYLPIVTTSAAYADRSQMYILEKGTNWLSDNSVDIEVNETGLLQMSNTVSTAKVEEAIVEFAESAAVMNLVSKTCQNTAGTHVYRIPAEATTHADICGMVVTVKPLGLLKTVAKDGKISFNDMAIGTTITQNTAKSGIFYRQQMAYSIKITGSGVTQEVIKFSPTDAPVQLLPASHSFFADSSTSIVLNDGMPTKYKNESSSELVGLFAIPAKVIGTYFEAVGGLFTAFSKNDAAEAALLQSNTQLALAKHNSERALELAKVEADRAHELAKIKADYKYKLLEQKTAACKAAVNATPQDTTLIAQLGCND